MAAENSGTPSEAASVLVESDHHPVTILRIVQLAVPQLPLLIPAVISLFISASIQLVYPQAVAWMTDIVAKSGNREGPAWELFLSWSGPEVGDQLSSLAIVLIGFLVVQGLFAMLRAWLFTVAGERVVAGVRAQLFEAILRQDTGFFDMAATGELTSRLGTDASVLQNTVTVNVSMGLRFGLMAVGSFVAMLVYSPELTGVTMAIVPVLAIGAVVYGRIIRRLSKRFQDALADATQVAEESIAGIRTVRAFAAESRTNQRFADKVRTSLRLGEKRALAGGIFQGVVGAGSSAAIAAVVWYGGSMVLAGELSIGTLSGFLLYTFSVAFSLAALAGLYGDFMKAIGASKRVFHLLDHPSAIESDEGLAVESLQGRVQFEAVEFRYPSRPDEVVLDGFDLTIEPGEAIALVGPSGSGKSTVARLLSRFYDVTGGRVVVDGHDVTALDPRSLRRHVGVVAQEPILFATSIGENIRYSRPDASDDDVREAAKAANALEFIESFERGIHTEVGERGVRLSGGQKQRIAIARAILKDPAILILDEATSALDTESEHLVQEALDRLMQGRTTVVIAHRLSTVRDADRVLVLDGGKVVEQGTHDALMTVTDGRYRSLVERQFMELSPG